MNQTDKSPRQRANAEGATDAKWKEIEKNFREKGEALTVSYDPEAAHGNTGEGFPPSSPLPDRFWIE